MKATTFTLIAILLCLVLPQNSVAREKFELDIEKGSIFRISLGMDEKAVRNALKRADVERVDKVEYPGRFMLQCPGLISKIGGALVFHFDDGNTLTRIYSNAKEIKIGKRPGSVVGMNVSDFTDNLGAVLGDTLLPNKKNKSTQIDLGKYQLSAISDLKTNQVLAWQLEAKQD